MTDAETARLREDYLARLDAQMRSLPHGVASEIRAGIVEELQGLDAAATAERIAQLGDPAVIAYAASAEASPAPVATAAPPAPSRPATATRAFAIVAALALGFGGIVLPIVGWLIGAVLVGFSGLWRTWEKIVAILVPLAAAGLSIVVATAMWSFTADADSVGSPGGGDFSAPGANPLMPAAYDIGWSTLLVCGLVLVPASGLWLLWRLRGRAER